MKERKSLTDINKRIIKEVDSIDAPEKMKDFLKDILVFEFEHVENDSEKYPYKEEYSKLLEANFEELRG